MRALPWFSANALLRWASAVRWRPRIFCAMARFMCVCTREASSAKALS